MPINTRAWVASADAARWPLAVSCSQIGCNFHVCASDWGDAEATLKAHEENGPCPYGPREARNHMPAGKSLREMQWDRLDEAVRAAMGAENASDLRHTNNGIAQGIAWCIFMMDQPFWAKVEDVLEEAAKRFRISIGKQEFSETPGYHYPHHHAVIEARLKEKQPKQNDLVLKKNETVNPLDSLIVALGEKKVGALVRGVKAGLDADTLADIYGLPLSAIKRVSAQPDRFVPSGG